MMIKFIRFIKRLILGSETKWRRIKFGPARGMITLISRASNLREELGVFEYPLKKFLYGFSKGMKVAYDVGAERGYYTLAFTKLMDKGSVVYSFEANKLWTERLEMVIKKNKVPGEIKIINAYVTNRNKKSNPKNLFLDEFVHKLGNLPPDIIKMDIEGEELNALKGAFEILQEKKPKIILEVHSRILAAECEKFLRELGYAVKEIKPGFLWRLFPEARCCGTDIYNGWLVAE